MVAKCLVYVHIIAELKACWLTFYLFTYDHIIYFSGMTII